MCKASRYDSAVQQQAHSNRQYIKEALKDKDHKIEPDVLTKVVQAVREAMQKEVPGPMEVMAWIEREVGKAFKRGAD